MSGFTAEMLFEEILILFDTGRCPRCGVAVVLGSTDDEFMFTCPGCGTGWGGSI